MSKIRFKPSGVATLLSGVITFAIGIIGLAFLYGYVAGGLYQGGEVIINQSTIEPMFVEMFLLILIGFVGGLMIGMYVEANREQWLESLLERSWLQSILGRSERAGEKYESKPTPPPHQEA